MSFGATELIIILVIVMLLFGTTKLRSMGTDLGAAFKGFKAGVKEGAEEPGDEDADNEPARISN